jgi:hypothetical protein
MNMTGRLRFRNRFAGDPAHHARRPTLATRSARPCFGIGWPFSATESGHPIPKQGGGRIGALIRDEPVLRWRAMCQARMFGAFTAFWTAIGYELIDRHGLTQAGVGLFALAARPVRRRRRWADASPTAGTADRAAG